MSTLSQMLPWLRPYRGVLVWGVVALVATNALASLGPWILKGAIDSLEPGATRPVWHYAVALVVVAAFDGVTRYIMRRLIIGVSRSVEYDLRRSLYERLQRLPLPFFQRFEVGDLMARVTNDLNSVRMFLGPGLMYTANTALMLTICIALMLRLSPQLALYAFLPMPLVSISVALVMQRVHRRVTDVQEGFATLTTRVRENLEGVRVIKAFGRESTQEELFEEASQEYLDRNMALARIQRLFFPAMTLFTGLAVALVLWKGGTLVMDEKITLGTFVAFSGYLALLMWPMAALGWTINLFQRGAASWVRIRELLGEPIEEIARGEIQTEFEAAKVSAHNLHYSVGDREILRGVSFEIRPGETVALVGPTGSGKSTLVKLLARLMDPSRGSLSLGGKELRDWDLRELRAALSVVPQEAFLFSESIHDNLLLGRTGATEADVRAALEAAALASEIDSFQDGADSVVGERGVTLSGGQRQRTTLARALLRRPALLVLDDAFSNMDTATEETILAHLPELMGDVTILLVSHRLSTFRRADRILYLENGEIVESGTHRELVEQGGAYERFVRRQRLLEELERDDSTGEVA